MKRRVAIGKQNFASIREGNYFYIDKTSFLKEWWECGDDATLISRPRRFGKTLNISMMEHFFSNKYSERGDLFEGLSIWQEEKYRQLQGTYPVISLSFAGIKDDTFQTAREKICDTIAAQYQKYREVRSSELLTEGDKLFFDSVSCHMSDYEASMSLHKLSDFLQRYYGKKVIILLDEYDTPMQEAYVHGYWKEIVSFMRSLFNSTFKTNPYLERALMTGITRVSKESIFSDLNHLEVVTATSERYATSFGFTEEEVFSALEEYGLSEEKDKVKSWYDGFIFGKVADIYNPWSIINFLAKGAYAPYWANTSSNGLVSNLIREGNGELKNTFENLLKGERIKSPIDEQIVFGNNDYIVKQTEENEITWLVPNSQKNEMEPIIMVINPHTSTTIDMPHEGQEFGYILEGKIELVVGNQKYICKKGETFYFSTDKNHYLNNNSDEYAKLIWVSSPPNF